ncbi:hypothetical protein C0Q70_20946 [Pomacea canaliculata]|uniref:ethanolamine kinase n=2 Tax=Pomacea canaliculata TaxID=400727 RepID=A0A2T7NB53_POMCA|nr:hypothetical protein C0Q70_20946 [Pomacea canaliculata]
MTNKLVGCFLESQPDEVVLLRINGEATELIIDRKAEVETFVLLHAAGCSPPLYAVFNNGIAYGFFPGKPIDEELVRDEQVATLIAKNMARLHVVRPKNSQSQQVSYWPQKTQSFLDLVPTEFDDPRKQKMFQKDIPSKSDLQLELEEINGQLQSLDMPVVFCHNDLLLKNIIFDADKGEVNFIDYEYAFLNHQAYDIGNHFCEYAGVETVNYDNYPDRDYQLLWLQRYLQFYSQALGHAASEVSERDVERLYVQVNKCACAAHFFWGIWALIQAKNSSIDFDFLDYAKLRLNEYFRRKKEFFCLSLP